MTISRRYIMFDGTTSRILRVLGMLGLVFALLGSTMPVSAGNGAVTETIHISEQYTFVDTIFCPDVLAEVDIQMEGVIHFTERPNGTMMAVGSLRATFEATTLETNETYTGRYRGQFQEIYNSNTEVLHTVLNFQVVGPDGSKTTIHVLFHMNTNPNNTNFNFEVMCR
jgi:hypothetical protein